MAPIDFFGEGVPEQLYLLYLIVFANAWENKQGRRHEFQFVVCEVDKFQSGEGVIFNFQLNVLRTCF